MTLRTVLATITLGLATTGLVAVPAPAMAGGDDDVKVRTGSCSMQASYRMRLADAGDDPDRLRTVFAINSDRANRSWTVRVFRGNTLVHKQTKRTGPGGNVRFAKTFRGDDDHRVRVVARSGYGETCRRAIRLDD
jgi:hypothetical protein